MKDEWRQDDGGTLMPVLFVGHGSPVNAIEDNAFARGWQEVAGRLLRPRTILCISAHWETAGTRVTALAAPRTIHDFGGFPRELYRISYPAPGDPALAQDIEHRISGTRVSPDRDWGLDHGCWVVLRRMFPNADIPVVQLSLDQTLPARRHWEIGAELSALRRAGVLILGSGNIVHNLGLVELRGDDFNAPFGFDWALEASKLLKELIAGGRRKELCAYESLGRAVRLAVPTPEHFLPMLYALALREPDEPLTWFNDVPVAGSLTMTSFLLPGRASS
jgi:4,5-DOPA dioxygenase extradiol